MIRGEVAHYLPPDRDARDHRGQILGGHRFREEEPLRVVAAEQAQGAGLFARFDTFVVDRPHPADT